MRKEFFGAYPSLMEYSPPLGIKPHTRKRISYNESRGCVRHVWRAGPRGTSGPSLVRVAQGGDGYGQILPDLPGQPKSVAEDRGAWKTLIATLAEKRIRKNEIKQLKLLSGLNEGRSWCATLSFPCTVHIPSRRQPSNHYFWLPSRKDYNATQGTATTPASVSCMPCGREGALSFAEVSDFFRICNHMQDTLSFQVTVHEGTLALEIMNESLTKCSQDKGGSLPYTIPEMVVIAILAGALSIMTVLGNCMVMISFKIDKQLQTISNYFLFSLAVADFAIGLISMPLFTISTILGYWPLGRHICDTWLALDYLASNASVLNLLIISFDRYFSVTRPLTYRAKRTTTKAAIMIGCAWGVSLLLWPPWIYAWPYIEGKRTVPEKECYIQFIETNHYITFGTAIAAFYLPATVMSALYWKIWRETKKRQKDLPNLQAGKNDSSKRSNSSDEAVDLEDWKRGRAESGTACEGFDGSFLTNSCSESHYLPQKKKARPFTWAWIRDWCISWWHSWGKEENEDYEDTPSDMDYETPVSVETPLQSSVSRCTSLNVIRDPYAPAINNFQSTPPRTHHVMHHNFESRSLPSSNRLTLRSLSNDSVYTILIRLPPDSSCEGNGVSDQPSIKMIENDGPLLGRSNAGIPPRLGNRVDSSTTTGLDCSGFPMSPAAALSRRPSQMTDVRIPLNAKIIPKQLAGNSKPHLVNVSSKIPKKRKKAQEKKQDTKAAKTLCAILLSFILTWTPYNILVLLKPVTTGSLCIPQQLWDFFYYLCYINSTINPVCYALCNTSFRRTYVRILTCKWHSRNRSGMNRGFYN